MKKYINLLSGALLISSAALGQNEWNSTSNSTSAMYRDGFVAIGTGAAVSSLPFAVKDPTSGTGTKIAFGNNAMQGSYGTGDAALELSCPTNASGANFNLFSGIGSSNSELTFAISPFGASIISQKGSSGTAQPITIYTQGTTGLAERMRIQTDGKVGIGIPSSYPGTYKLYVTGGILTEKVKVAVAGSANWSDHVFYSDYALKPLNDVASYINKNKHLPGIPSSDEVVKDGIDLGSMDAKLLEKIEELFLYTIELKKQIDTQKTQIETLKNK